jgi:hypothetical protein
VLRLLSTTLDGRLPSLPLAETLLLVNGISAQFIVWATAG